MKRRVLVLRHGILISRLFMGWMARYFRRRGYTVHNRSYHSTRKTIQEHAEDLSREIREHADEQEKLGGEYEFYAVTHSVGGLILRYALSHFPMPPLRRVVQVVPPNQGSATARHFRRFALYRWIYGDKSGAQLASDPPGIFEECGSPRNIELGIIAGTRGFQVYPVPLPEPHDGVVSLEETRLDDFPVKQLPFNHTPILWRRRTCEEVEHFLEHGRFLEEN